VSATTDAQVQELQDRLSALDKRVTALGDPPSGDHELYMLADQVDAEAKAVSSLASREASVPGPLVFVSGGALRLLDNIREVTRSYFEVQTMLEQAAHELRRKANQIHDDKIAWDKARYALDGQRVDVGQAIDRLRHNA
jgi:hypothetical protein